MRKPRIITCAGRKQHVSLWAKETGLSVKIIVARLHLGWSPARALKTAVNSKRLYLTMDGRTQHLMAWSRETGINRTVIASRLDRGWTVTDALTIPTMRCGGNNRQPVTYRHKGRHLTIPQWSRATGVAEATITARLKAGWHFGQAITQPVMKTRMVKIGGTTRSLREWCKRYDIALPTVVSRLKRGWPAMSALSVSPSNARVHAIRNQQQRVRNQAIIARMLEAIKASMSTIHTGGSSQTFTPSQGTGVGSFAGDLHTKKELSQ